ncbi:hypothetical protein [Rhodococcus sp. LW-XY12]|uniref:hypothetical protein n=1 Tax=Rhodococcus sp. LW-XY12 TaxID=2856851 RepID=UPI0035A36CD3
MWFGSWSDPMPVVRVGAAAYLWLVVRTANLGKTNPGQTQRLRGAGGGALIPAGTEFVGGLGFDQRLQACRPVLISSANTLALSAPVSASS